MVYGSIPYGLAKLGYFYQTYRKIGKQDESMFQQQSIKILGLVFKMLKYLIKFVAKLTQSIYL